MLLINDPYHKWTYISENGNDLYFKGQEEYARNILKRAQTCDPKNILEELDRYLCSLTHYNGGALETDKYIIAWTDHIRSWPLFYTLGYKQIVVSNSASKLKAHAGLDSLDDTSVIEFAMAGFVTGKDTLYNHLFSVQPGEFLLFDKQTGAVNTHKYFKYSPEQSNTKPQAEKMQELGRILDETTLEIIKKADGRTIWVPLSAGLDSRILLCKLHEHGYRNIETFTYGPRHNFEAIHAKRIAQTLNVPWRMIHLSPKTVKRYFNSSQREDFWDYAGNLKAIPCMREFSAMCYLHEHKIAKPGDIFLNGQSGDYITGGHIPAACFKDKAVERTDFTNALIGKHYSLWHSLKIDKNLKIAHDKIGHIIGGEWESQDTPEERAAQSEYWEYEGRQICYVVNGQRIYEFLGYNWEMPLWDKRLVDFCRTLFLSDKKDQFLYKAYLKDYNYKGLFPEKEPHLWRWPIPMLWVVVAAQFIGRIKGAKAKEQFYNKMRSHGHYSNQYAFFPPEYHRGTCQDARNVVSLYVPKWFEERQGYPDSVEQFKALEKL